MRSVAPVVTAAAKSRGRRARYVRRALGDAEARLPHRPGLQGGGIEGAVARGALGEVGETASSSRRVAAR